MPDSESRSPTHPLKLRAREFTPENQWLEDDFVPFWSGAKLLLLVVSGHLLPSQTTPSELLLLVYWSFFPGLNKFEKKTTKHNDGIFSKLKPAKVLLLMAEILHHLGCKNPVNNGINYLSTGAGFLPSTVVLPFLQQ